MIIGNKNYKLLNYYNYFFFINGSVIIFYIYILFPLSSTFLSENKLTQNSRALKEEVDYSIELLVPEVAFDVESGEMSDSPYEFATEDEIESGEADVTTYTDGDELDEYVFGRSYKQALHFAKEYPHLIKINTRQ